MKIGLFIPSLYKYDAMGNDVLMMYKILKEKNFDIVIFAQSYDDSINAKIKNVNKSNDFLNNKDNLVIYHHGVYTDFFDSIVNSKCIKVFRYHNITYPELFEGYDSNAVKICSEGRKQLDGKINKFDYYLSCSNFNNDELINNFNVDKNKTFILPPFHNVEEWKDTKEDAELKIQLQDGRKSFLMVGRLSPNKNHQLLIKGFADYFYNYDQKSVLHIVGKIGPQNYYEELVKLVNNLKIDKNVIFYSNGISETKLKSLYRYSDVFIMTSKHEGFCVPIVESMYFGLPIISSKETALQDTVDKNGILLDELSDINLSEAFKITLQYREELSKISKEGYSRYALDKTKSEFDTIINQILNYD